MTNVMVVMDIPRNKCPNNMHYFHTGPLTPGKALGKCRKGRKWRNRQGKLEGIISDAVDRMIPLLMTAPQQHMGLVEDIRKINMV